MQQNIPRWLLPLTEEEQSLMDMFSTVKALEREAKICASIAAKAKLVGTDEFNLDRDTLLHDVDRFKAESNDNEDQGVLKVDLVVADNTKDAPDAGHDPKIRKTEEIRRRQEAKLEILRSERDEAVKKKAQEDAAAKAEEDMRQRLLNEGDSLTQIPGALGPSLKKKQQRNWTEIEAAEAALVENLVVEAATREANNIEAALKRKKRTERGSESDMPDPSLNDSVVHDFDSLNEASVIFPTGENTAWIPSSTASHPLDGCLILPLSNADSIDKSNPPKNTIVIKFMAPSDSKRFSFNIVSPDHDNYNNVLFHFNPRQFQKGGTLVLNHKSDGIWGQAINIPMALLPVMFGEPCTLIIQITNTGFDIIIQGLHCARMEHRTQLKVGPLVLQCPSTDDYGSPESWTVSKVWFFHKDSMAASDLSNVFGVDMNVEHPKKLFVRGLSRILTDSEAELRRAELERAFKKYGGSLGVSVSVSKNTTFAFIECESERLANLALSEMSGLYTISKARRTREESFMETKPSAEPMWD